MSPEKRWKRQERRVASLLGLKRNPRSGISQPDAESNWLVVENKDRKELPIWIADALAKARQHALSHRLGIVTLTTKASPQVLVVMDLRDFRDWFGKG